jgi:hypothetical protein
VGPEPRCANLPRPSCGHCAAAVRSGREVSGVMAMSTEYPSSEMCRRVSSGPNVSKLLIPLSPSSATLIMETVGCCQMSTFLHHTMSHSTATFSVEECNKNTRNVPFLSALHYTLSLSILSAYNISTFWHRSFTFNSNKSPT